MDKHYRNLALVCLGVFLLATAVPAQTSDGELTSFGKRTPSVDEWGKAFKPSELQSMNIRVSGPIKKAADIQLVFPFGSADISPQVKGQLGTLGEFLQTANLGPGEFRIEGHTDGVGSPEYNRALSERRALAVKNFLVSQYKINENVLATAGVGAAHLKDGGNPASEVNRRVEFIRTVKE